MDTNKNNKINGVDINFGAFEASIIAGLACALRIPSEILLSLYNSNYSESQAALDAEFLKEMQANHEKEMLKQNELLFQENMSLKNNLFEKAQECENLKNLSNQDRRKQ